MSCSSVGGGSLNESPYKIDDVSTSRMTVTHWLPNSPVVREGKAVWPSSIRTDTLAAIFVYVPFARSSPSLQI